MMKELNAVFFWQHGGLINVHQVLGIRYDGSIWKFQCNCLPIDMQKKINKSKNTKILASVCVYVIYTGHISQSERAKRQQHMQHCKILLPGLKTMAKIAARFAIIHFLGHSSPVSSFAVILNVFQAIERVFMVLMLILTAVPWVATKNNLYTLKFLGPVFTIYPWRVPWSWKGDGYIAIRVTYTN